MASTTGRTITTVFDEMKNWWNPRVDKALGVTASTSATSSRGILARSVREIGGTKMGMFGIALGAYQGYGGDTMSGLGGPGLSGAVVGAAEGAVMDVGFGYAGRMMAAHPLVGLGAAAAGGAYMALDYGNQYMKKRGKMELSNPTVDNFGTVATMRQRSLMAMSQSHLNMRSALGNEAVYLHR